MPNRVWCLGVLVCAVGLLGVAAIIPRSGTAARAAATDPAASFAVVELFTSEGCSSCPPADEVLADLAADARHRGRRVFPLSFHVDYWDRLGWDDPYGDAAHSRRQGRYAAAFGSDRVYTPQMVVNGTAEFIGSDRGRAAAEIDQAMEREPASRVTLRTSRDANGLAVGYAVTPAPRNAVLNVALVERGLTSKVRRGENGGRTLRHENVVRAFETQAVADGGRGTIEIALPPGVKPANASLVVYVQDGQSMNVLAAAAADLPPARPTGDTARVK